MLMLFKFIISHALTLLLFSFVDLENAIILVCNKIAKLMICRSYLIQESSLTFNKITKYGL